jgi:hypothetical protein
MLENTALRLVLVGTVFQLDGLSLPFSLRVRAFLDREFTDRWKGRGVGSHLLVPSFSTFDYSGLFLLGVYTRNCLP